MPIAPGCSNGDGVLLQELDRIGRSAEASWRDWPEAWRPVHTSKGLEECFKATEAVVTTRRLATLSHSLQGSKELKMTLTTGLKVGAKVKTHETIVTHDEADPENTPQLPTWRAKCWWISCRKKMGYHAKDPKI
jgi:hypothetical protein